MRPSDCILHACHLTHPLKPGLPGQLSGEGNHAEWNLGLTMSACCNAMSLASQGLCPRALPTQPTPFGKHASNKAMRLAPLISLPQGL